MLNGTDGIVLLQSGPTGTEDTRLKHGAVIHKQQTRMGQLAFGCDKAERLQIFIIPLLASLLLKGVGQYHE